MLIIFILNIIPTMDKCSFPYERETGIIHLRKYTPMNPPTMASSAPKMKSFINGSKRNQQCQNLNTIDL
jgi:hypothetical protein